MPFAYTVCLIGIDGVLVEVEADLQAGLPSFSIVGLPDAAVKESKERVKAAIKSVINAFPMKHITVNLAPADLKKDGTTYDLPIAVSIILAEHIKRELPSKESIFLGELALDGRIRAVTGVLPAVASAKALGFNNFILPLGNKEEALAVGNIHALFASHLHDIFKWLQKPVPLPFFPINEHHASALDAWKGGDDFSQIVGQDFAKRAMLITAAGGHNIIMDGPPGSGKTMLSRRLFSILPDLNELEAIETTKIYSVIGKIPKRQGLIKRRPFRSPHHTISDIGLIGGGSSPKPGEVSLAHNGVLFLDEFPEFRRSVLEAMRQPMEDGFVNLVRAQYSVRYPARFVLVASMNPCPCGYFGHLTKPCICTPFQIARYRAKVSGPLLDRIDLHVSVPAVSLKELSQIRPAETSSSLKVLVKKARLIQTKRFFNGGLHTNAQMGHSHIKMYCMLSDESKRILEMAFERYHLSLRSLNKILKVARTIADLEECKRLYPKHILEALQFRYEPKEEMK